MTTTKNPAAVKWARTSEHTQAGHVYATEWSATLGKFELRVTNYPGSRTLDWSITIPGTGYKIGSDEDRYEYTVARLKEKVIAKAEKLNALRGVCE